MKLVFSKNPYELSIYNKNQNLIYKDLPGRSYKRDLQGRVYHYSEIDLENDAFYGLGESTGPLNKNSQVVRQAPRDSLGYNAENTSPLYKHIPFYIRINKNHQEAIGLFYHNTFESFFDMGCERSGYWKRYSYFCADGGDLDCYFINGPNLSEIIERYTDLTGKTAFSPIESLGYLGSTMYYVEFPTDCDK